jgi:hypothetical protein
MLMCMLVSVQPAQVVHVFLLKSTSCFVVVVHLHATCFLAKLMCEGIPIYIVIIYHISYNPLFVPIVSLCDLCFKISRCLGVLRMVKSIKC